LRWPLVHRPRFAALSERRLPAKITMPSMNWASAFGVVVAVSNFLLSKAYGL